jgi:hypothetical protein
VAGRGFAYINNKRGGVRRSEFEGKKMLGLFYNILIHAMGATAM